LPCLAARCHVSRKRSISGRYFTLSDDRGWGRCWSPRSHSADLLRIMWIRRWPPTSMHRPSETSSNESTRRQKCPTGESNPRKAPVARREEGRRLRSAGAAWCFVAPALVIIALFFLLPVFAGLAMSLTDFDIYALADSRNLRFVGLHNYVQLLQSPLFWQAFGNTLYFVVVGVPLSIAVSFGAALLLHSRLVRFRAFFRTALFAPVVTTLVAVAVIWRYLFHPHYGLLNYALGRLGLPAIDWLGD